MRFITHHSALIARHFLTGALLLALVGCLQHETRLQSEDDAERDKDSDIKTIGDVTTVANANPIYVSGITLVVDLEGTGGNATANGYRALVEDQLRKRNVPNIKELLASP